MKYSASSPYRGRGFGRATRSAALASIPKGFGDVFETTVETAVRVNPLGGTGKLLSRLH